MKNPFQHDVVAGPSQYRPEWDVPELNAAATGKLLERLESLRSSPGSPRKIPLLLATPGYGKTHLFGRLAHRLGDEVLLIFVPQVEDPLRSLDHIRRATVESLFRSSDGEELSSLEMILARLCHESVLSYFDALPAGLQNEHRSLRERLESDWSEIPHLMRRVQPLWPFVRLADSIARRHPHLRYSVVKSLVLGWSPVNELARRWLRGEELSDEDQERLEIGRDSDPPTAGEVLRAVSALLPEGMPIVLCCDQLEAVLRVPNGMRNLANDLVGLLQDDDLSNLLIVISCLEDRWQEASTQGGTGGTHTMFYDRVEQITLETPDPHQIALLIRQRLKSWSGHRSDSAWPFDEESLHAWADQERPSPRGALKFCSQEFDRWLAEGQPEKPIILGDSVREPLEVHFRREWAQELKAIRQDDDRSYKHADQSRLNNALLATLELVRTRDAARGDGHGLTGITSDDVIRTTSKTSWYGHKVTTSEPDGAEACTVLMLTKAEKAQSFQSHLVALERALDKHDAHGVLIHPREKAPTGKTANTKARQTFDRLIEADRLTYFPLESHQDDYEQIECFWSLRSRAQSGDLLIDGRQIDVDQFDELVVQEVKYLDQLQLLELVSPSPNAAAVDVGADASVTTSEVESAETVVAPVGGEQERDDQRAAPVSIGDSGGTSTMTRRPVVAASGSATAEVSGTGTPPVPPRVVVSRSDESLPDGQAAAAREWAELRLHEVVSALRNFRLEVAPEDVQTGARFARLTVSMLGTTRVQRVYKCAEDLKARIKSIDHVPVIDTHGDGVSIDVQLPKEFRQIVTLGQLREYAPDNSGAAPVFPVGQDVAGRGYWADLSDANHAHYLVAGTTGSGKSEFLKSLMAGMAGLLGPDRLRFIPIDPKRVTFQLSGDSPYFGPPGTNTGIAHTAEEASPLLEWCGQETERRYQLLRDRGVSDLNQLDPHDPDTPPRVVVVCDEFPDLISDPELKEQLNRFLVKTATKARAAGIHLVLAAQRPDARVVTTQLRSNLPGRICLRVASTADSKIVLDRPDAADLLGHGDLLWRDGVDFRRLQGPLVSMEEFEDALRIG